MLNDGNRKESGHTEEEALQNAVGHLSETVKEKFIHALIDAGSVIAWHLEELRPASVPYTHSFQITDERPICFPLRRMPTKHNENVKHEIDEMIKARIIKPASSPWGFPVVIA